MKNEDVQNLINQALTCRISSKVEFSPEQLDALQNLNEYCVNTALDSPEVAKRPLKVIYKSNEEFKTALVAIMLCHALTNPHRKVWENKNYFEKNISLYQGQGNVKEIDFGKIDPQNVEEAINWDIIEDWKLYRDRECGGIKALIDEKTNLVGLENYVAGGNPLYEFARFHRKFTEKENKIAEEGKIATQNAFRDAVIQSVTSEVAKQQLLEGKDPMDIINSLLNQGEKLQIAGSSRQPAQITDRSKK